MRFHKISPDYAVAGQITPDDIGAIKTEGFKSVICIRPDNEGWGQPSYDDVSKAASAAGLQTAYIPVSGMIGEGQLIKFEEAMKTMPKPILGYCLSGGRAASLYSYTAGR